MSDVRRLSVISARPFYAEEHIEPEFQARDLGPTILLVLAAEKRAEVRQLIAEMPVLDVLPPNAPKDKAPEAHEAYEAYYVSTGTLLPTGKNVINVHTLGREDSSEKLNLIVIRKLQREPGESGTITANPFKIEGSKGTRKMTLADATFITRALEEQLYLDLPSDFELHLREGIKQAKPRITRPAHEGRLDVWGQGETYTIDFGTHIEK